MRVLVTCPPMLGMKAEFEADFRALGIEPYCPDVVQTLSEKELAGLVPQFDGWIIGDDPATRYVLECGRRGSLKAAVKWGVGVDNVDIAACNELGLAFANTPQMFGGEVADVALGYVIGLARQTFAIDRGVREGGWPKNRGTSLEGKTVGLIGYGAIGRAAATRFGACGMRVVAYDPGISQTEDENVQLAQWPECIEDADFLVFTCSLNPENRHMLNDDTLACCKAGVRIVNVARGPLIDESSILRGLSNGKVHSAALDVFEEEPLPETSPLREHPLCIFGSHNGSNTEEAVRRASEKAIKIMAEFLGTA
jgi:D-3-phosphoglycerate dehydrogenase